ncbi:MAG TPA: hypothetical protein VFY22_14780, partial [Hydrogenophaga sp.]|nr:hypothetical protein [Hydrogenophaga sp.]
MNLFSPCCVRPTQLLLLAALGTVPLWTWAQPLPVESPEAVTEPAAESPRRVADEAGDAASPAGQPAPSRANRPPRPPAEPRFDIQVEADDDELAAFLSRNLELQRYQRLRDLDDTELGRLLANAPANLRDLLGTRGYFAPVIDIALTPAEPG